MDRENCKLLLLARLTISFNQSVPKDSPWLIANFKACVLSLRQKVHWIS